MYLDKLLYRVARDPALLRAVHASPDGFCPKVERRIRRQLTQVERDILALCALGAHPLFCLKHNPGVWRSRNAMASTSVEITPALQPLLKEASWGQLATLMPDGAPHVTQVWLDSDGTHILVNTVASHQKVKNVRRDPRVAINVHDPAQPYRIANIRGKVVEMTPVGADEHIDVLAKKYLGVDQYPFRRRGQQRIVLKIWPERIHTIGLGDDSWHPPATAAQ